MLTDINSLTRDELKNFSEFINSPYFNKSGAMKKLYSCLEEKYPDVTEEDVAKDKISRYVFNDLIVSDVRIRKIESEFNKLFEKFLLHNEIDRKKTESQISLLPILRRKLLYKTFKKKLDEIEKYSDSDFGVFDVYYLNKTNYYLERKIYSQTGLIESTSDKAITYLNLYFVVQGLHFNYNNSDPKPLPMGTMIKSIYEFIENNKKYFLNNHPDIMVMYYSNLMSEPGGIVHLKEFEIYYEKYRNKFDPEFEITCYQVVLNILNRTRMFNPSTYNSTIFFEFFQKMLRKSLLRMNFERGSIMAQTQYFTCFNTAVNFQAFELAEKFALEHNKYLSVEFQDKMMNITTLILNFFRKDYTDVLKRLNEVSKDNAKFYVYTRYIKLMLLFEMNEFQTLHYEIQAVSKHLQRLKKVKALSETEILRGNYFVKLITVISSVKEERVDLKSKKFAELKSRLNSDEYMHEYKFWFLERVRDLEKGLKNEERKKKLQGKIL